MLTARSRWRAWVRRGVLFVVCALGAGILPTTVAHGLVGYCSVSFNVSPRPAVGVAMTATPAGTYGWNANGSDACANLAPGYADTVHPSWYRTRFHSGGTTMQLVKDGSVAPYNTYTPTASDAGYELWISQFPPYYNEFSFKGVVAYTPTVTPAVTGSGPTAGGTWITMNGTGYDGILGATTDVTFGGVAGTNMRAYCTYYGCLGVYSPPHAAGTVDVNVVNDYSTTKVGTFTYYDAPTVTSATPSSGPASDRAWVTLTGTGFVGATYVSFGGTSVNSSEFVVDSDTSMRVYRPTHAAGTVSVVVTGPGGSNASNSLYTYYSVPPVVNSALTKSATVGTAMSTYTVSGTNTPTSYSATDLPAGLAINTSNGQITGTPTVAGTFNVTIGASNSAGGGTATLVMTIAKGTQSGLTLSTTNAMYGSPLTLSTSGGSGSGAVTFAVSSTGTAGCSMASATTLTSTTTGTCAVTATKAADDNYNTASVATTVTVGKGYQATVMLTSTLGTYGSALALVHTGGSGTGAVTYAVTATGTAGCSLATSTSLTSTGAGTCMVTATKALETRYFVASSAATTVTFVARTQTAAVVLTSPSSKTFGSALTLTASGGSGTGAFGYAVVDPGTANCSVLGAQLSTTGDVGSTCTVKATRAADANNLARDSDPLTITVAVKAPQPALSVVPPAITYGSPVTLATTGGAGPGEVTFAVTTAGSAGCSIAAGELTTTGDVGTTCGVTATKATSTNYLQAASTEVTVTVTGKAAQTITFAAPADRDYTPLPFTAVATSNSDLTVGLVSATPTICSASGLSVTTLLPGTCILDADQAGDGNYLPATTVRRTFDITPATQAVTWDPIAQAVSTSSPLTMLPAVGADAGAITYSVTSTGPAHCAISDPNLPVLTFDSPGSCTVRADAASTATHQAGSSVKVFVIAAPPVAATSSSANGASTGVSGVVVIKVRSLDPITANGGLAPGAELTTVDGEVVAIRVEANAANTGLDVIGPDWRLSVVVNGPDGLPTALATGGILTVTHGSRIDVTGSGFEERSQARVYLLEHSVHLGSLMTGHDGGLDGSVVAPTDARIGRDTLQINGFTPDRKVRSLSLGVRVVAQSAPKPPSVGTRIYFGYKSAVLTSKAKRSLRSMIAQMPHAAAVGAQVTGVVRSKGATGADRALASRRVAAVVSFLRRSGVSGELRSSVRRVEVLDGYRDRRVEIAVRPAT